MSIHRLSRSFASQSTMLWLFCLPTSLFVFTYRIDSTLIFILPPMFSPSLCPIRFSSPIDFSSFLLPQLPCTNANSWAHTMANPIAHFASRPPLAFNVPSAPDAVRSRRRAVSRSPPSVRRQGLIWWVVHVRLAKNLLNKFCCKIAKRLFQKVQPKNSN